MSNWVWLFAYPTGCIMTLAGLAVSLLDVSTIVVSLGVSVFLGFILFCSNFYGCSDVKALVFIGLTVPTIPITLNSPLRISALPIVLVIFCISAILILIWPLSIFILNLKDRLLKRQIMFEGIQLTLRQKIWLLFTSRRIPLNKLGTLKYFPSETVVTPKETDDKPTRKMLRFVKAEVNLQKYIDNLQEHSELYQNGVLASPTIPTTCFLTVALTILPLWNLFF
ncbi:MAG: hypothetical protein FWF66_02705 [Candidatus Bathyarchaeota archaeon]|nr:hypothetical protein [Candidatus Termiticorpusculum sp.]